MSSEVNEGGLEQLGKVCWRSDFQKNFEDTMNTPPTVTADLANPCVRTKLQIKLIRCLVGIRKQE